MKRKKEVRKVFPTQNHNVALLIPLVFVYVSIKMKKKYFECLDIGKYNRKLFCYSTHSTQSFWWFVVPSQIYIWTEHIVTVNMDGCYRYVFMLFYERKLSPSGEFRQLMKKKNVKKKFRSLQRHCSWFFYDVEMVWFFFIPPEIVIFFYVLIIPACNYTNDESFIHLLKRNAIEHYIFSEATHKMAKFFFLSFTLL